MTPNRTTRRSPSWHPFRWLAGLLLAASWQIVADAQVAHPPFRPAVRPRLAPRPVQPQQAGPEAAHAGARPVAPAGGSAAPAEQPAGRGFAQNQQRPVQPQPVRPNLAPSNSHEALVSPNHPNQTQEHLSGWMESHRNLPLAEQQRALENEPGFHNLPTEEQQRLHTRLTQLNSMPPEQRQRLLQHNEAMERLAPPQRQQIRNVMGELGHLREDRRGAVDRAFYATLRMPPQQRQAWLNSPQFRSQFSDEERATINHLLEVQPFAAQAGLPGFQPRVPGAPQY